MLGFLTGYLVGRRRRRYRWTIWHVLGAWLVLGAVVVYWWIAVPVIVAGAVAIGLGYRARRAGVPSRRPSQH